MKKTILAALCLLASIALFAESYEVKSITGKVAYAESEKGKMKPVTVGMTLTDETILNLATNSKIVISADGKEITLRTPKKATVSDLILAKQGIAGTAKKGKGSATASSRASDVMAEGELDD